MGMDLGKALALTAATGLVAGLAACDKNQAGPKEPEATTGGPAASSDAAPAAKECCKGKNDCKGKGNCKVEGKNDCAGQNECKGKGGCKSPDCKGK